MRFDALSKPPTSKDEKEWYRWYYRIVELLNGLRTVILDHDKTQNVEIADDTSGSDEGYKHVTNSQVKKYEDHRLALSDDTDTDDTVSRNVTYAQVKKYEDHRLIIDGNPHGTNWDQIEETATFIPFNVNPPAVPDVAGYVRWNEQAYCLEYVSGLGNIVQIGQENWGIGRNDTGGAVSHGQVVYMKSTATGYKPNFGLAKADVGSTCSHIGVVTAAIAANQVGPVTTFGLVNDVDTSAWSEGTQLYLSATTAGALTATAPDAPNFRIAVATVLYSHSQHGILFVYPHLNWANGITITNLDVLQNLYVGDNTDRNTVTHFTETAGYIPQNLAVGNQLIVNTQFNSEGTSYMGGTTDGNYSVFEYTTGFLARYGTARAWDDLYPAPVSVYALGANAAAFTTYSGNMGGYEFVGTTLQKELLIAFQFSHAWAVGTTVYPHIHVYIPDDATGGDIKMWLEYHWDNINDTGAVSTTTTNKTITRAANAGISKNHIIAFDGIVGTGKTISSVLSARLYRVPTDSGDTFGSSIWLRSADIHICRDTDGSRQEYIK